MNVVVGELGELSEFTVHAVTEGIAAAGQVTVGVTDYLTGRTFRGHGVHTDVITASGEAYVAALNRLLEAHGSRSTVRAGAAEVTV